MAKYEVEVDYTVAVRRLVEVEADCDDDALDTASEMVRRDHGMTAGYHHIVVIDGASVDADNPI